MDRFEVVGGRLWENAMDGWHRLLTGYDRGHMPAANDERWRVVDCGWVVFDHRARKAVTGLIDSFDLASAKADSLALASAEAA